MFVSLVTLTTYPLASEKLSAAQESVIVEIVLLTTVSEKGGDAGTDEEETKRL